MRNDEHLAKATQELIDLNEIQGEIFRDYEVSAASIEEVDEIKDQVAAKHSEVRYFQAATDIYPGDRGADYAKRGATGNLTQCDPVHVVY